LWSEEEDVYHALQAALLPLLPVAPSIAGALRTLGTSPND